MFGLYQGLLHATRVRGVASVVKRLVKAVDAQHPQGAPMPSSAPAAAATMAIEKALASLLVFDAILSLDGDAPPFILHFVDLVPLFEARGSSTQLDMSIVRAIRLALDLLSSFEEDDEEATAAAQGLDSERPMAMQDDTQAQNGAEDEEEREAPRRNRRRAASEVAQAVEKLLALRLRRGIKDRERARTLLATVLAAKEEGEEKGALELVFAKALEQGRRVAVS